MVIITLGLAVLFAKLFPYGQYLFMLLPPSLALGVHKFSSTLYFSVMFSLSYLLPLLFAIVFVRKTQLRSRLPREIPGRLPILAGLILIALYLVPRLFASTIPGGGPAYAVAMLSPFFIVPADILIVYGVFQVLLAALPRLTIAAKPMSPKLSTHP